MIWNEARECMNQNELFNLQSEELTKLVKYMYHNVDYYREKIQKSGMNYNDICSIEDLKKLPFTSKEDLKKVYPHGMYAVNKSELVRYHAFGKEENELIIGYTAKDIDIWSECAARAVCMAGIDKNDIVMVAYTYGMYSAGFGAHYGVERMGAAVIPFSVCDSYKLIDTLINMEVTAIMCTPTYLLRIADIAKKSNVAGKLKLRAAICGDEPLYNNVRERIESLLGIKVYDMYGKNLLLGIGIAGECECQNSMHIQEDCFAAEIIDSDTLEVLPDGREGELVITTLQREGAPLIRYRTGDRALMTHEKCGCGRKTARVKFTKEKAAFRESE